jgi:hypothetical protein
MGTEGSTCRVHPLNRATSPPLRRREASILTWTGCSITRLESPCECVPHSPVGTGRSKIDGSCALAHCTHPLKLGCAPRDDQSFAPALTAGFSNRALSAQTNIYTQAFNPKSGD